jgi:hypothetical protein
VIGGGVCDTSAIATPPGEELATVVDESTKCEPCAWWHRRRQSRGNHVVIKWSSSGHQEAIGPPSEAGTRRRSLAVSKVGAITVPSRVLHLHGRLGEVDVLAVPHGARAGGRLAAAADLRR